MASTARGLSDPPPNYDPRWSTRARTLASSLGRWLGVEDREGGGWEEVGTMPRSSGYYGLVDAPSDSEDHVSYGTISPSSDNPSEAVTAVSTSRPAESRTQRTIRYVRKKWNKRKTRQEIVNSLPTFRPWFTVLVALVNIALFVAVCVTDGIASVRFTPKQEYGFVKDLEGRDVPAIREKQANFFIGPSATDLVHHGAKYATCMRKDSRLEYELKRLENQERLFKCCQASGYCGMMSIESCDEPSRAIVGGLSACTQSNSTCQAGVAIRPCCIGSSGQCVLTTSSNCTFHSGKWHSDKLLCSEALVACLQDICELTWSSSTFSSSQPDQWYRLLLAIFIHNGVIQLVILLIMQLYFCYKIERKIGWLRIFLIFIISGVGGYLTSAIFDPDSVGVGPAGALYGLLGVQLVELLQSWRLVNNPYLELIKLLINIVVLLALGLLPYIDNFANIGGFIFGILSSFILVPFISLGKWDRLTKLCLISIALPTLVILLFVCFVIFYNVQDSDFCSWCKYLNCVPVTDDFCDGFDLSSFYQQSPNNS